MILVIVMLGLVLQSHAPRAPSEEHKESARPTKGTDQSEQNHEQNSVIPRKTADGGGDHQDASQKPESRNPHNWVDWLTGISTAVIALFTIVSVAVFWNQIRTARFSERAWLLVEYVGKSPHLEWQLMNAHINPTTAVSWKIKNYGRTPARIRCAKLRFHFINTLNELPHSPDYGDGQCADLVKIPTDGTMFGPNEETPLAVQFKGPGGKPSTPTDVQMAAVRSNSGFLMAYGIVEYDDVFKKDHETRFCHIYKTKMPASEHDGIRGWFSPGGPESYNRAT